MSDYHPFELLGIEPTLDENIIRIAYEQQLKRAESETEIFTIKVAYQECLRLVYEKLEKEFDEEILFTDEELKQMTENKLKADHEFKAPEDPMDLAFKQN